MLFLLIAAILGYFSLNNDPMERSQESCSDDEQKSIVDLGLSNALTCTQTTDDLKQISGVGPKIEGILHSIGVYTFAQIAAWNDEDVQKVDTHLKFSGRIIRDDWIGQAKELAES
jgi:NADH-quinone oxidoreductase subunit E